MKNALTPESLTDEDLLGGVAVKDPLEIARDYIARGWSPVPMETRTKRPTLQGWPKLRLTPETVGKHFNGEPQNVGVILGEASGGLVDIDLDCSEALALAPRFLPPTGARFGRPGNPESHWLYTSPGLFTDQARQPDTQKMLCEIRSNTAGDPSQTVFPGSLHMGTGERIEWTSPGDPATIDPAELQASFDRLAAATLLARTFPAEGGRHHATMALIGTLVRAGWTAADVESFVRDVRGAAAGVNDKRKPIASMVQDAMKRESRDEKLFGKPAFVAAFGRDVAGAVIDRLQMSEPDFDEVEQGDGADTLGLRLRTPAECAVSPNRGYVVKGLLAPGDMACIFGVPGAGKSLIAPHIAYAVARGEPAFGMRTKQGAVLYVAAEDAHGMSGRVSALRTRHGDAENFYLVDGITDVAGADLPRLLAEVESKCPALIVIDTLAMAFPSIELNNDCPKEGMRAVVLAARKLGRTGAAVVVIHHPSKAAEMPLGHTCFNGALDVSLYLHGKDPMGIVRGEMKKNRNGPCDLDLAFRIDSVPQGIDEDGDQITSAIVAELTADMARPCVKLSASEQAALAILRHMAGVGDVTESEWRKACVAGRRVSGSDDADSRTKAFKRAHKGLANHGLVYLAGELVRLADDAPDYGNAFDEVPDEGQES